MSRRFVSEKGRVFYVREIRFTEIERRPWPDPKGVVPRRWEIEYEGAEAGRVYRSQNYAAPRHFQASTRELYWRKAIDAPVGIGFDVAAFTTLEECMAAWMRSADEILDWSEGAPVFTIYAKRGFFQRSLDGGAS